MTVIILTGLTFLSTRAIAQHNHENTLSQDSLKTDSTTLAIDPICKMEVLKTDSLTVNYNNKDYYFCSENHRNLFLKSPQKYLSENEQKQEKNHEHNSEQGMMGMSTTMLIIMGGIMAIGMIVGMIIRK